MVARRPLVLTSGLVAELADGDSALAGYTTVQAVAGSGLVGGGYVSDEPRIDFAIAPNPSGLIFVGDALGNDGSAVVLADTALASGVAAVPLSEAALASGNAALATSVQAQASGNAAISVALTVNPTGPVQTFTAATAITAGSAVGLNDAGQIETIRPVATSEQVLKYFREDPSIYLDSTQGSVSKAFYIEEKDLWIIFYTDASGYAYFVTGQFDKYDNFAFGTPVVPQTSLGNGNQYTNVTYDPETDLFLVNIYSYLYVAYLDSIPFNTTTLDSFLNFTGSERTHLANAQATFYTKGYYHPYSKEHVFVYFNNSVTKGQVQRVRIDKLTMTALPGALTPFSQGTAYYPDIALDPNSNRFALAYGDSAPASGYLRLGYLDSVGSGVSYGPITYTRGNWNTYFNDLVYEPSIDKYLHFYYPSTTGRTYASTAEISGNYLVQKQEPFQVIAGASIAENSTYPIMSTYNKYDKIFYRTFYQNNVTAGIFGLSVCLSGEYLQFNGSGVLNPGDIYAIPTWGSRDNRLVMAYRDVDSYGAFAQLGVVNVFQPSIVYDYSPKASSYNNVLGIATQSVASGSTCVVALPGAVYTAQSGTAETGSLYYCHAVQSGALTTLPTTPTNWSGQAPWAPVARAVSPSGFLVLNTL